MLNMYYSEVTWDANNFIDTSMTLLTQLKFQRKEEKETKKLEKEEKKQNAQLYKNSVNDLNLSIYPSIYNAFTS